MFIISIVKSILTFFFDMQHEFIALQSHSICLISLSHNSKNFLFHLYGFYLLQILLIVLLLIFKISLIAVAVISELKNLIICLIWYSFIFLLLFIISYTSLLIFTSQEPIYFTFFPIIIKKF
jgi:hypothetical protein